MIRSKAMPMSRAFARRHHICLLAGWQFQNEKADPPPGFFVSVASKGLRVHVSGLESTLAGIPISVDSKGLRMQTVQCRLLL
jgi:hypothetical protein